MIFVRSRKRKLAGYEIHLERVNPARKDPERVNLARKDNVRC